MGQLGLTGCPNKHGNSVTTSISSLFYFCEFQLKQFIIKSWEFQNVIYHICAFIIDGDIKKSVQILIYWITTSPSILKIQKRQTMFSKVHGMFSLFFCNFSIIGNRRRWSSRLLMLTFIGTPCSIFVKG